MDFLTPPRLLYSGWVCATPCLGPPFGCCCAKLLGNPLPRAIRYDMFGTNST